MRITVLGNFSGRNAGDNAILGNLVRDVAAVMPDTRFLVPTLNPASVARVCRGYNVQAMGLMPWHGALKILGLSTLRAMTQTDCILITDNILFDKAFFNPAFNYLSTIALFAKWSQRKRIPIILYNASVGPITTPHGANALRRVLRDSPLAILRDAVSRDLVRRLVNPAPEMTLAADCALNTELPPPDEVASLGRRLGIRLESGHRVGLNVNVYVDAWKVGGSTRSRADFIAPIAAAFDTVVRECDAQPVFFVTQLMDRRISEAVRAAMQTGRNAAMVVVGPDCNYREMTGLLASMDLLIAMRTHALILGTAALTPAVNLNAYPKSAAYMDTIGQGRWNLDITEFTEARMASMARQAWQLRGTIRRELGERVPPEKQKARSSAARLRDLLSPAVEPRVVARSG